MEAAIQCSPHSLTTMLGWGARRGLLLERLLRRDPTRIAKICRSGTSEQLKRVWVRFGREWGRGMLNSPSNSTQCFHIHARFGNPCLTCMRMGTRRSVLLGVRGFPEQDILSLAAMGQGSGRSRPMFQTSAVQTSQTQTILSEVLCVSTKHVFETPILKSNLSPRRSQKYNFSKIKGVRSFRFYQAPTHACL
jgi:hypothetical protein